MCLDEEEEEKRKGEGVQSISDMICVMVGWGVFGVCGAVFCLCGDGWMCDQSKGSPAGRQ